MPDDAPAMARLFDAVRPWREQLVLVGGWAHRLHRLHPDAAVPPYAPIVTRDADLAFDAERRMEGSIATALREAGFLEALSGEHVPPVSHFTLGHDGGGFQAEFLSPLRGSGLRRDGLGDATVSAAGVTAQKLRHLELLLVAPWHLELLPGGTLPIGEAAVVRVANPVSFMAQKLLIHALRVDGKKAQDILYLNDTLELFGSRIGRMRMCWADEVRPALSDAQVEQLSELPGALFAAVTDPIRQAALMAIGRGLSAQQIQVRCSAGLGELFAR